MSASPHTSETTHPTVGHVVPLRMLFGTCLALLALTGLTVWTGLMDLHGFDLTVALLISTIKSLLVCLIFMHLRWDKHFNGFIFLVAIAFVGLLLAITLTDSGNYQRNIQQYQQQNPLDG